MDAFEDTTDTTWDDWYEHAFGQLYPLLYRHRDDELAGREMSRLVDFLELDKSSRILDMCCGTGRHMLALLRLGYNVWGFDLSTALLQRCRSEPLLAGRVVRADMRVIPFVGQFDLALSLFTSFGYFATDEENEHALARMAATVKPGGMLVMDHASRVHTERSLVPENNTAIDGYTILQRRRIEGNRVIKSIHVHLQDEYHDQVEPNDDPSQRYIESVRLYRPDELAAMFSRVGLTDVHIFGTFDGQPYTENSRRMILTGVKR